MNIIEYSKKAHEAAKVKGWWDEPRPMETRLLLIISEICECMEADRKGKWAKQRLFTEYYKELEQYNELEIYKGSNPNKRYFRTEFEAWIKDTVEDELADTAIRILDLLGHEQPSFLQEKFDRTDGILPAYLSVQLFRLISGCMRVEDLPYTLKKVFAIAEYYNINLEWHIDQKMKYNETRTHKHGGKSY